MAISGETVARVDPISDRVLGRGDGSLRHRTPAEYEGIWHELDVEALIRSGEPNAARYAANQAFAAIEAEDSGRVVGRGDYESYF